MDLKSMLNDSSVPKQPPRLHTAQSSFDRSAEHSASWAVHSERPPSYHPSSHLPDSRSQPGSYFASQSPQQNSASTPSAGPQSIYGQSPGPHGHLYTPRDSAPPPSSYSSHYGPSPSPAGLPPSTPGSTQYYQGHNQDSGQGNAYTQTANAPRPPTRDELNHANGISHAAPRQMSPPTFTHQPPPVTPLGPPVAYPRPSPQAQRPPSQGYDPYRRSSISSIGSSHSRDYSAHRVHPEPPRADSVQRTTYLGDEERQREREQSLESVSPKTIPRPYPQRQSTSYSQEPPLDTPPPPVQHYSVPPPQMAVDKSLDDQSNSAPGRLASRSADNQVQQNLSSQPSSVPRAMKSVTPQPVHSSLPAQPSPPVNKQASLKRTNSTLSTPPAAAMPPRKRLRRDEIPIFAQTARRGKPIRFNRQGARPGPPRKSPVPKQEFETAPATNGQPAPTIVGGEGWYEPLKPGAEPSITNTIPHEDLTRYICDWIVKHIVHATPPKDSKFEIEAKIGSIISQDSDQRVVLPVLSEAIFDKSRFGPTRFASTMNQEQHKRLNEFLNDVAKQSHLEVTTTKPNREVLRARHTRESDEFSELTPEGRKALPQSLAHWVNSSRHPPKVRKTFYITSGEMKEQIIKTRIADLEVYNPNTAFDYRISLSLETIWKGEPHHLAGAVEVGMDRQKDRISYRHMFHQIDLTQITYPGSARIEHELEVEISDERIKEEFELLRNRQESHYEELIRTFIDNVRILCRHGTMS